MQSDAAPPCQVKPRQLCSPESCGRAGVGEAELAQLARLLLPAAGLEQQVCAGLEQGGQVFRQRGVGGLWQWNIASREVLSPLCFPLVFQQMFEIKTGELVQLLILLSATSLPAPGSSMTIGAVDETRLVSFQANSAQASMGNQVRLVLRERTTECGSDCILKPPLVPKRVGWKLVRTLIKHKLQFFQPVQMGLQLKDGCLLIAPWSQSGQNTNNFFIAIST